MKENEGRPGERKVQRFFDANIGNIITFPNAKTKSNAQIADLLVWLNWKALLVEVKTRISSKVTLDQWVKERVADAANQITKSYARCVGGEQIYVNNDFYNVRFDDKGVAFYSGLIVLNYEGTSNVLPSVAVSDIYRRSIPIHAISYDDLAHLSHEIDTFPDLRYYLKDRFDYIKKYDIPLGVEKEVIGRYKLFNNRFPDNYVNFQTSKFWREYQTVMEEAIERRNAHNEHGTFIDGLEEAFRHKRKLHGSIPLGLSFAWELGAMSRRERAIVGERIDGAKLRFERGGNRRYFSFQNPSTTNWLVFVFSNGSSEELCREVEQLTRLKLIKEAQFHDFEFAAYGFAFQVSRTHPIRLLGLRRATVISPDAVTPYSDAELEAAISIWGDKHVGLPIPILEFPPSEY
ncbi:MAG TPA: hypothetical protein VGL29_11705 [Blastocatellia bacterium]